LALAGTISKKAHHPQNLYGNLIEVKADFDQAAYFAPGYVLEQMPGGTKCHQP